MAATNKKNQSPFPGRGAYLIMTGLLTVAAFLLGSLYTKVQYLEKGSATTANGGDTSDQAAKRSKYKSFDDAMKAVAKAAGVDDKKLLSCMNSGEKKNIVAGDQSYGESLGVQGTPGIFVNGRFLAGAFPFEMFKEVIDKELAGTGSDDPADYSQTLQNYAQQGAFKPQKATVNAGASPARGSANAAVTLVEFSDFQCPFCQRVNPTLDQILSQYRGQVKLVFKHFPLAVLHPRAQSTAEASECARDQDKFWEMHDKLFELQTDWSSI